MVLFSVFRLYSNPKLLLVIFLTLDPQIHHSCFMVFFTKNVQFTVSILPVRIRNKTLQCVGGAVAAVLVLTTSVMWYTKRNSDGIIMANDTGYLVDTKGCVIPEMNPFHPSVSWLFSPKTDLRCKGPPPLLRVDYNKRTIKIDGLVSILHYKERAMDLHCVVRSLQRPKSETSDDQVVMDKYGHSLRLTEMHITSEFIFVQCKNSLGEDIYSDYISFIQKKTKVEERMASYRLNLGKVKDVGQERLSVALLGIDSVSRLNFLRHFPRTYRYITEAMMGLDFVGYTKVADNTLPNLIAILTGRHMSDIWNGSYKKPFDDLNLIWKAFSGNGYRTLFAEDSPAMAPFNYLRKGFRKQPVDYYYRPFTIAVEVSEMITRSAAYCFNARMEVEVVLQWLWDFLKTFRGDPLFSLTFTTRLTHDSLNSAGWADGPYYRFFKRAHSEGLFNNTILFFFSDHGMRYGPIRHTYIGKLEERLPFLFLVVPDWFAGKYRHIRRNLETNVRRLTSPFDVYATMMDVIGQDYTSRVNGSSGDVSTGRGLSLFTSIPETRTCEDAGISAHWCVCQVMTPVDIMSDLNVHKSAHLLVRAMNDKLTTVRHQCAILTLHGVISAYVSALNNDVLEYKSVRINKSLVQLNPVYDYLVTFRVSPSYGTFEGMVRFSKLTKDLKVMNSLSRISKYENQSHCVNSSELRLFCYCLN